MAKKISKKKTTLKHEDWEGFTAGEDLNAGDMICRVKNRFYKCRGNKKIKRLCQK